MINWFEQYTKQEMMEGGGMSSFGFNRVDVKQSHKQRLIERLIKFQERHPYGSIALVPRLKDFEDKLVYKIKNHKKLYPEEYV